MSQSELLKILQLKIKDLEQRLKHLSKEDCEKMLWIEAVTKEDLAFFLGISIHSVAKNIQKLLLKEKIVALKKEHKEKQRYIYNDKLLQDLVDLWNK